MQPPARRLVNASQVLRDAAVRIQARLLSRSRASALAGLLDIRKIEAELSNTGASNSPSSYSESLSPKSDAHLLGLSLPLPTAPLNPGRGAHGCLPMNAELFSPFPLPQATCRPA